MHSVDSQHLSVSSLSRRRCGNRCGRGRSNRKYCKQIKSNGSPGGAVGTIKHVRLITFGGEGEGETLSINRGQHH